MDISNIINGLNENQRQVVTADPGNQLVLAGAGSGKTLVLVHRIAWLVQVAGYSPHSILAVTFTNKAAAEMRNRIERLLGISTQSMWVGTFHSLAHRLLRLHWKDAGLIEHFQIIDSDDQYRLVRRLMKSLNIDESHWPPKQAQWYINGKKDEGLRAKHMEPGGDPYARTMLKIYLAYEEHCEYTGLVDFAELLLRSHELLMTCPEILMHYQNRFRYVLVDELQDTNTIQYAFLRLLVSDQNYIMGVGDDDQSIYGWRGAKIENIQRMSNDFSETSLVRLEQNYRSTSTILNAANALIENNNSRMGKQLWTNKGNGDAISIYSAFNEIDEARFVVERIKAWLQEDRTRSEIAILYRSNAQSRVIEEALLQSNIPYRVYGGQRFFERAEIKDALGYLRLLVNRHDDAAFERIVNTPTRGIGQRSLGALREYARENHVSLWQASCEMVAKQLLSARAAHAIVEFLKLIDDIDEQTKTVSLSEQMETVTQVSGLIAYFERDRTEKGRARIENLEELVSAARQFEPNDPDQPILIEFLSHAALEAGDSQANEFSDCVQMMTLHSAKGLEFPLVFIGGLEERLFPHEMSMQDPMKLEEERRLCYVGITRAMEKLYMCYAERRNLHGRDEYHRPSRFLREIPQKYFEEVRLKTKVRRPISVSRKVTSNITPATSDNDTSLMVGQRVRHHRFGEGIVLNYEGQGEHARVEVQFADHGRKWLVLSYANLIT